MTARHHQALYRRWRAQTFGEIVGQEPVVATLRNAVRSEKVSHALLFVGPRGTGKTSMARIVAKALNCTDLRDGEPCDRCEACTAIREGRALDVTEIDAASNRGIDSIRELREKLQYAPSDLRMKVYILDEAHQITKDGWNALLKSLEEPPEFVTFMFASTAPQEFPAAVLSRIQRYDLKPLTVAQIEGKLHRVLQAEGRTADDDAINLVARLAAGGMRDAESMLDQLLTAGQDPLTADQVRDLLGIVESETVDAFVQALADGAPLAGLRILDALDERGRDLRGFMNQVVEAVRASLVRALTTAGASPGATASLAAAARRLAAIDPTRGGAGGLRFQLELALLPLAADAVPPATAPPPSLPAETPPPSRPARPAAPAASAPASAAPPSAAATTPAPSAPAPSAPAPSAPAPSAPEPPKAAPARASTPSAGLDELVRQWPEVVAQLSRTPSIKPIISICRPIGVDGNVITLGFPESQSFFAERIEHKRASIEQGISEVLGRAIAVRSVATNLDLHPPADPDTDRLLDEARRIFGEDLVDVGEVS